LAFAKSDGKGGAGTEQARGAHPTAGACRGRKP
jgi:hypothetical protein